MRRTTGGVDAEARDPILPSLYPRKCGSNLNFLCGAEFIGECHLCVLVVIEIGLVAMSVLIAIVALVIILR